jgi:hypothetical protein
MSERINKNIPAAGVITSSVFPIGMYGFDNYTRRIGVMERIFCVVWCEMKNVVQNVILRSMKTYRNRMFRIDCIFISISVVCDSIFCLSVYQL